MAVEESTCYLLDCCWCERSLMYCSVWACASNAPCVRRRVARVNVGFMPPCVSACVRAICGAVSHAGLLCRAMCVLTLCCWYPAIVGYIVWPNPALAHRQATGSVLYIDRIQTLDFCRRRRHALLCACVRACVEFGVRYADGGVAFSTKVQ